MSERIGIVLVHGVGEQKRFEHLSREAHEIIRSLQNDPTVEQVTVRPRTTQDSEFRAAHPIWLAETAAPLRIDFRQNETRKSLHIHEVWWADLDGPITLWRQLNNHRLEAGGFKIRTESPDTGQRPVINPPF